MFMFSLPFLFGKSWATAGILDLATDLQFRVFARDLELAAALTLEENGRV